MAGAGNHAGVKIRTLLTMIPGHHTVAQIAHHLKDWKKGAFSPVGLPLRMCKDT
jgi:hypothetical protein